MPTHPQPWRRLAAVVCPLLLTAACLVQAAPPSSGRLAVAWGPVLSNQRATSIEVGWATNVASRGDVVCGGKRFPSTSTTRYHRAVITGLLPARSYRYAVEAAAGDQHARSAVFEFRTPPTLAERWSFVVFGDTRSDHPAHRAVVNAIMRVQPRPYLTIHTGDLVAEGEKAPLWDTFFSIERALLGTIAYYPCMGNHEAGSLFYYDTFPVPPGGGPSHKAWYSFRAFPKDRRSSALFVCLNTELPHDFAEQARFLADAAQKADRDHVRWRFAFWHRPAYSSGSHGGSVAEQKMWVPVLEKYKFTAVFAGHDHLYERSLAHGVTYFTAGGGGAPLYPVHVKPNPYSVKAVSTHHFLQVLVSPSDVRVIAYKPDGTVFDRVSLK